MGKVVPLPPIKANAIFSTVGSNISMYIPIDLRFYGPGHAKTYLMPYAENEMTSSIGCETQYIIEIAPDETFIREYSIMTKSKAEVYN